MYWLFPMQWLFKGRVKAWLAGFGLGLALVAAIFAAPAGLALAGDGETGGFLSGLEDVPLMPGLAEEESGSLAFDTPEGRIVEAAATGDVEPRDVGRFYSDILLELGWKARGELIFEREGEVLQIVVRAGGDSVRVEFFVVPAETP